MNPHLDGTATGSAKKETFAPVPSWLLKRRDVSSGAKLAYARLRQYRGKNQSAWPSYKTLGEEIGLSRRHVINLVQELERHQLVILEGRHGSSNRYRLPSHPWSVTASEITSPPSAILSSGGEMDCTTGSETDFTQRDNLNETKKRKRKRWMIQSDLRGVNEQIDRIKGNQCSWHFQNGRKELKPEARANVQKLREKFSVLDKELLEA